MKVLTLHSDLLTPVAAFLKLRPHGRAPFLMESVTGGERFGRYSFLGFDPSGDILSAEPGRAQSNIAGLRANGTLRELLREFEVQSPETESLLALPFTGGLAGVIGFDWIHELERLDPAKRASAPVAWLGNYERFLIFDHLKQEVKLIDRSGNGERELQDMARRLELPLPEIQTRFRAGERRSSFAPADFRSSVERLKQHIVAGDIFQGVLSQRFSREAEGDAFQLYRALRRVNPSPFMFYHETPVGTFIGASPELQVGVNNCEMRINPIAGTRPRGTVESQDIQLERELRADAKERAEHMMLVDLARNDLGRACDYGSVRVQELSHVHRFSHVMHLVSDVRGKLRHGGTAADALAASFPAGTVSGAPKVRALEIILENEPVPREFYSGAAGFLSRGGNAEFCIMLRTAVLREGVLSYQAGAGIVADSVPETERLETEHKAAAMERALTSLESA